MAERGLYARFGKRALDLLLLLLAAPLLLPLALAVAAAVRLRLGPPVLFAQRRAGLGGRPFLLLKFRTLREGPGSDAERMTRLGRILRALALDEIPQAWNILRGEMSLVGPRPLPPEYLPLFTARERLRLSVRPGLAGLAQARGRNAVPWAERLEWDARYAEEGPRLCRDLAILLACLRVVLRGEGVAAPGHATMPALSAERRPA
ncbi:MAG: sugar transferase [Acetobacteraceae bacterium]|nr:sugar transferase [Acetobacteraceae bacterium]